MDILFISCHSIWKIYGGRENSLNNRVSAIVNDGNNVDIFYFNYLEDYGAPKVSVTEHYCKGKISNFEIFTNLIKCLFCLTIPFQSSLFLSNERKKELVKLLKTKKYDCIILDMIRLAPLQKLIRKNSNASIIMDLDDLISKRYFTNKGIMGQLESKNRFISRIMNSIFGKLITKIEHNRLFKLEKLSVKKFDYVTLISIKETQELISLTKSNNVIYFPMLIIDQAFDFPKEYKYTKRIVLGFAGLLKTPANRKSLEYVLDSIIPNLTFDFVFKIIGKVDKSLKEKYESNNIVFTGYVDDFKKELRTIDIFLCPMVYGTGIKTKILEAMAAGLPVLTNSVGVEGMFVVNKKDVIIIDDTREIINCLNSLNMDFEYLGKIAKNGNEYVNNYHSKNIFLETFYKIVEGEKKIK